MILRAAGWRQTTPGSEDHPSKSQVAEFHCGENSHFSKLSDIPLPDELFLLFLSCFPAKF